MFDDIFAVGLEENEALPCGALHILRAFAHAVALAGGTCLDLAGAGQAKALFGPAVGLELGHLMFLWFLVRRPGMSKGAGARRRFDSLQPPEMQELEIFHSANFAGFCQA